MRKAGGAGVRIDDVARAAGVSMKTVSRVFNHEPNVRPETRAKVEAAAKALNFRPNPSARSLAGRKSYLISTLYDNPSSSYVMQVVSGVLDACEAAHYSMMMRPVDYTSRDHVDVIADSVAQYAPDGLVLTPPLTDDEALLEKLQAMGVRYASISPREQNARIGARLDERRAVREMMAHIVGLGHRRIAHIKGHRDHGASEWRLQGYRDGLAAAGIAFDKALVVAGEFQFESGVAGAEALLSMPDPPTAIFAANDDTAAGVLHTAARRGVRVPQDLSVFGFDDLPMARQLWPSLTTVRQASRDMGRIAAEQLLLSIREPGAGGVVQVPYELVFRDSTGPRRAHRNRSRTHRARKKRAERSGVSRSARKIERDAKGVLKRGPLEASVSPHLQSAKKRIRPIASFRRKPAPAFSTRCSERYPGFRRDDGRNREGVDFERASRIRCAFCIPGGATSLDSRRSETGASRSEGHLAMAFRCAVSFGGVTRTQRTARPESRSRRRRRR